MAAQSEVNCETAAVVCPAGYVSSRVSMRTTKSNRARGITYSQSHMRTVSPQRLAERSVCTSVSVSLCPIPRHQRPHTLQTATLSASRPYPTLARIHLTSTTAQFTSSAHASELASE